MSTAGLTLPSMSTTATASLGKRIVFTGKNQVELERWSPEDPGPGEVRVRARWSLMSTGTETIVLHRRFLPALPR